MQMLRMQKYKIEGGDIMRYETKVWIESMHQRAQRLHFEASNMFEIFENCENRRIINEIRTINKILERLDDAFWDLNDELPEVEDL